MFPAIQLLFLSEELFLQLNDYRRYGCHILERGSPKTISRQRSASRRSGEPKQATTQSKDSPDQRRCPVGGGILPSSVGWRRPISMVGVPTIRTLVVISPTSHYVKWDRTSFKISGKGRQSLSQLTKDRESKVSGLALHCLYRRKN
jgi:hypothetical protein